MIIKAYKAVTKRMLELDKEMIEGLKGIGFKHDVGDDETGHQMKYFRRGGGYNLDAGSSGLMTKGELGLLPYDRIERFAADGALLKDGSTVPADLIVLATGYFPRWNSSAARSAKRWCSASARSGAWGRMGNSATCSSVRHSEGLWFIAGGLAQCRINSKYMALQIKAMELGKLGPLSGA